MSPGPTPVVLDVDTGVDDACALLLAALHPGLDLRGVTCVGGNAPLDDVVRNTLTVLDTCGRADVPVAAVISEYLDVADAFYDRREKGFVNGLLDSVAKVVRG